MAEPTEHHGPFIGQHTPDVAGGPFLEPGRRRAWRRRRARTPRSRPRNPVAAVLGWLWRHLRWHLVIPVVGGLLVLIATGADQQRETSRIAEDLRNIKVPTITTPTTLDLPDPQEDPEGFYGPGAGSPEGTSLEGTDVVTVVRLQGAVLVARDGLRRTYRWNVPSPALRRELAGGVGRRAVVTWKRDAAGGAVRVQSVTVIGRPTG